MEIVMDTKYNRYWAVWNLMGIKQWEPIDTADDLAAQIRLVIRMRTKAEHITSRAMTDEERAMIYEEGKA